MPCLQSAGISSCLPLCCPSISFPETSGLRDFAHLGSRLKHWPNHFSLLFSRKVSTGFTCTTSFPMSDVVQPGLPSCPSQHPHFGLILSVLIFLLFGPNEVLILLPASVLSHDLVVESHDILFQRRTQTV